MGTVHTLEALRGIDSARVAVMVTTDKVYRDHGRREIYGENDPLGDTTLTAPARRPLRL